MRNLIVDEKFNNKKLNSFILYNFKSLSPNTLYKALRKKDIKVNGKRVSENVTVFVGDSIDVYISDSFLFPIKSFKIIYEDDNILIVDKPSDLEVTGPNSLTSMLEEKYDFILPCHRLDRNTCGLVLFAKNNFSLEFMLEQFKNRTIEKHYVCRVYGIPKKTNSILEAYLFKDASKSIVYISDTPKKNYVKIITEYTILKKYDDNTCLLDVNLHTGKTHQIRAHLAHIGFPIIGDGKYGINEINKKYKAKTQNLVSYKLKFNFEHTGSSLDYLSGKEFELNINNLF